MSISPISSLAKNAVSVLGNSAELAPVILLEGSVTGGRTYQAYKRGGKTEAFERIREESIAAFFWIFGVKIFNKIGDAFGKHVLKLPIIDFDTGKDALRNPMENAMESIRTGIPAEALLQDTKQAKAAKKIFDEGIKVSDKALARFKFAKIALSVLASVSVTGIALPKFNQKLTANRLKREKAEKEKQNASNNQSSGIDVFKQKIASSPSTSKVSFSGNALNIFTHNLESNPIANLLSNDAGMLIGRTVNARNKDERIEILFRDVASIYFYLRCREDVKNLMQKHTSAGNLTKLNPNCAGVVSEHMIKAAKNSKNGIIDISSFLGSVPEEYKFVLEDFDKLAKEDASAVTDGVIKLEKLKEFLPKSLWDRAEAMSKLQPKQAMQHSVLTRTQLEDVLSSGEISNTEFLMNAYKKKFGDALTNDYKFISMKDINEYRKNITEYVNAVAEYAGKKGFQITEELIKKADRASTMKSLGFFALGFGISAAFLSTIIPKTQYLITRLRTGKNEFPGVEEQEPKKA